MVHEEHVVDPVRFAFVTVSDTRTEEDDESGKIAKDMIQQGGHVVSSYCIVEDDVAAIRRAVERGLACADVVVCCGGSGVAPRDVTPEAVRPLLSRELPGFGEAFRRESFEDIGSRAFLSRALAGVAGQGLVFCIPGSRGAAKLGTGMILDAAGHMLWEVRR